MLSSSRIRHASLWAFFAVVLAATATLAAGEGKARWGSTYIPNVELVTQDGQKVRFYDDVVKGRIIVISFIYTTCRDICPLVTARLAQVYETLGAAAGRDIHFVSISIDPENDTPQRLKEHADAFRVDQRWLFLTGSRANIDLVRHRLGERSRKLSEHRSDIILRNDSTGEWSRDSAFSDIGRLALTIRALDPAWRADGNALATPSTATSRGADDELPGQALFVKACGSCHTIGRGDRVGPDLDRVAGRRSESWIKEFIRSPDRMRLKADPYLEALERRYPRVRMPNLQLSEADAQDVVSYLKARSFAIEASRHDVATGKPAHHHGGHGAHPHRHH